MRRSLQLSFASTVLSEGPLIRAFDVRGGNGRIELQGALSAGSAGWELSATARWRRRIINVYITARQVDGVSADAVEDHGYTATLEVPPGWYHLRLNHVYRLGGTQGPPTGLPMFERSVWVK